MKRTLYFIVALSFLISGCSANATLGDKPSEAESQSNANRDAELDHVNNEKETPPGESRPLEVNKGLFRNEITFPASFFEGQDIESIQAAAKEKGASDVQINDDGSVTYKVSKDTYEKMRQEAADTVTQAMDELKKGEDFKSIKDVEANASYSEFTMTVDKEAFQGSFDGLAALSIAFTSMFYQIIDGVQAEHAKVTIHYKDQASGEVFDTTVFPEDMGSE